eukprot:3107566-Prymnesium_polylepis.1
MELGWSRLMELKPARRRRAARRARGASQGHLHSALRTIGRGLQLMGVADALCEWVGLVGEGRNRRLDWGTPGCRGRALPLSHSLGRLAPLVHVLLRQLLLHIRRRQQRFAVRLVGRRPAILRDLRRIAAREIGEETAAGPAENKLSFAAAHLA